MMGKHSGSDQALKDTQGTNAEVWAKHRKVRFEKLGGEGEFREDEDNRFKDNQEAVDDGPECPGGLVRNRTSWQIIAVVRVIDEVIEIRISVIRCDYCRSRCDLDGMDVGDQYHNGAAEDKNKAQQR